MVVSNAETREFQAEVKQLLNIVIHSLYTEREIFLRELISNAADALEKIRYQKLINKEVRDAHLPLEIEIQLDENNRTITISDTGIGMSKDELVQNLGTIAHSGSKAFLNYLKDNGQKDFNLIGQFGVGFYSAFMVADQVTVHTCSYRPGEDGYTWQSDGTGSYTIGKAKGLTRGTKIVLKLKEDAVQFTQSDTIKRIIRQYSSFVPFDIKVNGEKVNTIEAIWAKNKNEVNEEEYQQFYQYTANAYDQPLFKLHFSTDAPLAMDVLLFVPGSNLEGSGLSRYQSGVNLYCRKVLIQQQSPDILPEWLRFVKGVVDSEDLPLNISRETMQDKALVSKLRRIITRRLLKSLDEQAQKSPDKYQKFWEEFGSFIKEGLATDFDYQEDLAKLLRFESSKTDDGQLISLQEYVDGLEEQQSIYYLHGPSREIAQSSPYMEAFQDREVLFTKEAVDDYVLERLGEFSGKKFVPIDQANLEVPKVVTPEEPLPPEEITALVDWLKEVLGEQVVEVRESKRLVHSPVIALSDSQMTSSMQRLMQAMNKDSHKSWPQILEINAGHPVIKGLDQLRTKDADFAQVVAQQLLDNALISAGLMVEPRSFVQRVNQILEWAVQENKIG